MGVQLPPRPPRVTDVSAGRTATQLKPSNDEGIDGSRLLVRTDVRRIEEGAFFRVRHRVLGAHDHQVVPLVHEDEGGCADESWVRTPAGGWAPLHRLGVRQDTG